MTLNTCLRTTIISLNVILIILAILELIVGIFYPSDITLYVYNGELIYNQKDDIIRYGSWFESYLIVFIAPIGIHGSIRKKVGFYSTIINATFMFIIFCFKIFLTCLTIQRKFFLVVVCLFLSIFASVCSQYLLNAFRENQILPETLSCRIFSKMIAIITFSMFEFIQANNHESYVQCPQIDFKLLCSDYCRNNNPIEPNPSLESYETSEKTNLDYKFDYSVNDHKSNDIKKHKEERKGDTVTGEYSLVEEDGNIRTVRYYADWKNGFHAQVLNSKHK